MDVKGFVLKFFAVLGLVFFGWLVGVVLPVLPAWLLPWVPVIVAAFFSWVLKGKSLEFFVGWAAVGYVFFGGWTAALLVLAFWGLEPAVLWFVNGFFDLLGIKL